MYNKSNQGNNNHHGAITTVTRGITIVIGQKTIYVLEIGT